VNWPVGDGPDFQGVFDLQGKSVHPALRTHRRGRPARPMMAATLASTIPRLADALWPACPTNAGRRTRTAARRWAPPSITPRILRRRAHAGLSSAAPQQLRRRAISCTRLIDLAPPPGIRGPATRAPVDRRPSRFTGFVFKIQANMDPRHRDRMAFVRVCSGKFEKDMTVQHTRLNRAVRMSRPHRLFAQKRETVDEAYPGDVIGLTNPGLFVVGDTVSSGPNLQFAPIPPFQPEQFGRLVNLHVDKYKQFNKGLAQLAEEGVIQVLYPQESVRREPILAAVGQLQFDVVVARLAAEYQVEVRFEPLEYTCARWVRSDDAGLATAQWPAQSLRALDSRGHTVVLFPSEWTMNYCIEKNPRLAFQTVDDLVVQTEAPWFLAALAQAQERGR
jgi:peptide chain release factor 3